ncbi:hypothetical protein FA13DRAFT_1800679 [Coprinellus micaceus]|uniref:Uncharacterized protein n=1 Tax=Coprinellus micaceus TaxID=71717 RepID=A0A4Y7SFX5_COPMI|nr:hypothetical protein FA13DRAFT_1800679 [Coprinellus micaceus]
MPFVHRIFNHPYLNHLPNKPHSLSQRHRLEKMKATGIFALFSITFPIVLAMPTLLIPRTNFISEHGDHESDRVYSSSSERHHNEDYDYNHEKHTEFNAYDAEEEHKANEMEATLKMVVDCSWQPKSGNDDRNVENRGNDECEEWSKKEESGEREESKKSDKGNYYQEEEEENTKEDKEERKEGDKPKEEEYGKEDYKEDRESGRKKDSEWERKCTYPPPPS